MKKIFYIIFILSLFVSCSTKKTGITNRTYHKLTSWYNTVFNGNVALEEDLTAKKASYKDNYSTTLEVEPINPFSEDSDILIEGLGSTGIGRNPGIIGGLKDDLSNLDAQGAVNRLSNTMNNAVGGLFGANDPKSQAQGLDRAIEKGKKAIESHSMLIKGKEYNSMMGETYLLLGRAYYYKKDPFEAMNYLNYMNKTLVKNKRENEAKVYLALAQAQAGNSFEANEIYDELLKTKAKKRDKKFITRSYSQFLIDEERHEEAVEALEVAKIYNKGKYEKGRYNFIQGQLEEKLKKEEVAVEYYQSAYNKKPSPELEIKSQVALARLFKGDTVEYYNKISYLKKLTKKGLYQSRKNELLYAMALASLNVKKEGEAMEYFKKSIRENESDPQIRALAFQKMGDIYFSKPDYVYAGAYYDSAIARFVDPKMKAKLTAKNKSLKEVIEKYYLVKKNDSILAIVKMSLEQRNEYFQKHIDKLKKEEEKAKRELEKQMREGNTTVFATETLAGETNFTTTQKSGGKWYFYNTSLKQTGQSDFRRFWGDRTLMDNWRMSARTSSLEDMKNQLLGQEEGKNPRRFEVEYYVEKIPQEPSVLERLKQQRDSAELSLGIMYYDKLYDTKSATSSLEHLISTPPFSEDLTLAAMYNIYRLNKEVNPDLSKKYADLVTTKYPNTRYAENILNPDVDIFKAKSTEAISYYEDAYKKYEDGQYNEVKEMASQALEKYPTDQILAKFSLLSVFCDAKLGNKEIFISGLERIALVFERREEGEKAAEILKFFKEKEKLEQQEKEIENTNNLGTQPTSDDTATPYNATATTPTLNLEEDSNQQQSTPKSNNKNSKKEQPRVRDSVGEPEL